jgi:hypothetical protein
VQRTTPRGDERADGVEIGQIEFAYINVGIAGRGTYPSGYFFSRSGLANRKCDFGSGLCKSLGGFDTYARLRERSIPRITSFAVEWKPKGVRIRESIELPYRVDQLQLPPIGPLMFVNDVNDFMGRILGFDYNSLV